MRRGFNEPIYLFCPLLFLMACQNEDDNNEPSNADDKIRAIIDADANNELDDQHTIAYGLVNGDVFDVEAITANKTRNGGSSNDHYDEAVRVVRMCWSRRMRLLN